MSHRFTPGPWRWLEDSWNGGYSGIVGPNDETVLAPSHCNDGDDGAAWFDEFPSEADRNLLAAAPDLLRELERTHAALMISNIGHYADSLQCERTKAVIAKATKGGDSR